MIAFIFTHTYTEYLRTPTFGGMDSEPAGFKISTRDYTIVVPNNSDEEVARMYATNYAGNRSDPNFKILGIKTLPINAILDIRSR
jgi:hypothetical protein